MSFDFEMLQSIAAICKYLYKNPNSHKNTVRKELVGKGKIATKEKFAKTLESLIALGKVSVEKDNVSLCHDFVKTGVMQKKGNDFFVVSPDSKKHYKISKSVASGFSAGDILDFMLEINGTNQEIVVLGRNKTELENTHSSFQEKKKSEPKKQPSVPTFESEGLTLGRVVKLNRDQLVFIPNDKSIVPRHIPILNPEEQLASFENKLCTMNLTNSSAPLLGGFIVDVKGDAGNPVHEYASIAESVGAVMNWDSPELQAEIANIPTKVDVSSLSLISEEEAEHNHRGHIVDLRNLPFCPTDPEGARDKDDAIYSTYDEDGNLVIYTAIANVPRYVDLDSAIGKRYLNTVFTFYTPNRAYSVLPPELSTGVCSLVPNQDRHAFVVKTTIDRESGKVIKNNFYDALINCKHQYTYEDAQKIVDSFGDEDLRTHFEYKAMTGEALTPEEQVLMDFYAAQELKANFEKRRMLRFNTNKEYSAKFDSDQSTILDIEKVKHLQYHEVIEFFMITANESAAEFAKENKLDTIFRVHDAPNTRKIDRASEFFDILGIEFDGNFSAEGIRSLVDMVKNSPAEEIVNQFLIKMQSRAIYSDHAFNQKQQAKLEDSWLEEDLDPISHFALQSKGYSHTTAPIRRACDYAVIYNIMANIHGTKPLDRETIMTIIENANEMQKMIDEGEKSIKAINGVFYAENHIGEKLKGRINKIRYTSPEEGYDDELVAVVINEDKGICAEIPISQITGRKGEYTLSPKGCAVCDQHGNIVVKLCQSLDFIIEKADRQSMNVVGRTNKQLIHTDSQKGGNNQSHITNHGKKRNKVKKYEPNKPNQKHSNKGKRQNYNRNERGYDYNPDEFGFGE